MLKWLVLPMVVLAYLAATVSARAPRDRDHDRLPDRWERRHDLSTSTPSAMRDPDGDHLRNRRELRLRTHPRQADTDRDRLRDGAEVRRFHTNPRKRDTDGDGFGDHCELRKGTNPRKHRSHPKRRCSKAPPDSDGDEFPDGSDLCPHQAGAAPDGCPEVVPSPPPTTGDPFCQGYPEPRVYLENQSWWEPQNGPASHPGTGMQGHIHVETCFPLYQHYSGNETIRFDYTVRLHNMPGLLLYFHQSLYGEDGTKTLTKFPNAPDGVRCPVADCVYTFTRTLDLSKANYSGLHVVSAAPQYYNEPGLDGRRHLQLALPYWPIYLDNGKPPPPAGSDVADWAALANRRGIIGDSTYPDSNVGDYAMAALARADMPYAESPLRPKVTSGVWRVRAFFEKTTGFAWVDPNLHGNPPTKGMVVYEGTGGNGSEANSVRDLVVDTTRLSDGWHRLLLGTCNTNIPTGTAVNGQVDRGDHCGTVVVRFLVDN
jgi:hypothetical protein